MIYFYAEDEGYYGDREKEKLISSYPNLKDVLAIPTENELQDLLRRDFSNTCILAPYLPERISPRFKDSAFFDVIYLPNKFGALTTGQKQIGLTEEEVIMKRLGVLTEKPQLSSFSFIGIGELQEQIKLVALKFEHEIKTKGFLLAGMPGTGKSYYAKYLAAILGYTLVSLNLSEFMEKPNTIQLINEFFAYFENTKGRFLLWIDEIEKMFHGPKSQQVMGVMLTRINEANNLSSTSSFFIVATANNVGQIAKTNPEFFRNGRFDSIIFLLNPTAESAKAIFGSYIKKQQNSLKESFIPLAIINYANKFFDSEGKKTNRVVECRSEQIGEKFFSRAAEYGIVPQVLFGKTKEDFLKSIAADSAIKKEIDLLSREFEFKFDVSYFMRKSMEKYRRDSTQKERYVYTPAEIEYIVTDSYSRYYLLSFTNTDHDYDYLINRYKPLQVSVKEGVKEILSKAGNFIEV